MRIRLHYSKFGKYISRDGRSVYLAQLEAVSERVWIVGGRLGCRDPEDDKLLETALMGEVDCIATRDQDLQVISPFHDIPILGRTDFLGCG